MFRAWVLFFLVKLLKFKYLQKILWYLETLVLSTRFVQKNIVSVKTVSTMGTNRFLPNREVLFKRMAPLVRNGAIAYEFGVADGKLTRFWSDIESGISKWFGFDTFEGLPTDWYRNNFSVLPKGTFSFFKNGKMDFPEITANYDVKWVTGLIEDTLIPFLQENPCAQNQKILFIDVDLYHPTKIILESFKSFLVTDDLIYFDEGFDPWNEGQALIEALNNYEILYFTPSAILIRII
jgi:hypothetical protein